MIIRVIFEATGKNIINDSALFKRIANDYLKSFDADYAGYISVNKKYLHGPRTGEPCWQYIISNDTLLDHLVVYLENTELTGYHVIVQHGPKQLESKWGEEVVYF